MVEAESQQRKINATGSIALINASQTDKKNVSHVMNTRNQQERERGPSVASFDDVRDKGEYQRTTVTSGGRVWNLEDPEQIDQGQRVVSILEKSCVPLLDKDTGGHFILMTYLYTGKTFQLFPLRLYAFPYQNISASM